MRSTPLIKKFPPLFKKAFLAGFPMSLCLLDDCKKLLNGMGDLTTLGLFDK